MKQIYYQHVFLNPSQPPFRKYDILAQLPSILGKGLQHWVSFLKETQRL